MMVRYGNRYPWRVAALAAAAAALAACAGCSAEAAHRLTSVPFDMARYYATETAKIPVETVEVGAHSFIDALAQ